MDYMERKRLLPYGAAAAVAKEYGVERSYVSDIMRGHRNGPKTRPIRVALARKMRKPDGARVTVDEVWPATQGAA